MKKIFASKYTRFGVQGVLGVAALGFLGFQFGCGQAKPKDETSTACTLSGTVSTTVTSTGGEEPSQRSYVSTVTDSSTNCSNIIFDCTLTYSVPGGFNLTTTTASINGLALKTSKNTGTPAVLGLCQGGAGNVTLTTEVTCKQTTDTTKSWENSATSTILCPTEF